MYATVLAIHNILRWVVLIAGILAVGRALLGWFGKNPWSELDRRLGVIFTSSLDTQLLLGLLLYIFLSPITRGAFRDFGAAMAIPNMRFFAIEHIFYMLLAVVFGHLGSVFAKRAEEDKRHQRVAIWFGLSLIVILVGMPWMRPLFPGL